MKVDVDWKLYLSILFPFLGAVYLSKTAMEDVNAKLALRNVNITKKIELVENENVAVSTNFYDLMLRVIMPNDFSMGEYKMAHGILNCLNNSVGEYFKMVENDTALIGSIKKLLDGLFRVNGDKYLDKIGELQSIIYLMKSYGKHRLNSLEYKFERNGNYVLNDSKDADLFFVNELNGEKLLIDVLNINLDEKKIVSADLLAKLIKHRIDEKMTKKGFHSEYVKSNYGNVQLQPFMWIFDIEVIKKYKSVFSSFSSETVLPILCLRKREDVNQNISYDCVRIEDILGV